MVDHEWRRTGGLTWTCRRCGSAVTTMDFMALDGKERPTFETVGDMVAVDYLGVMEATEVFADCDQELVRLIMEG